MRHVAAALTTILLLAACGGERADESAAPGAESPAGAEAPAGPDRPPLVLSPAGGPPGSPIAVSFEGLAMREPVEIGFGDMGEHVILAPADADVDGTLVTTVTVPEDATPGTRFFFLANRETGQVVATPTVFVVTGADGRVTLSGQMSDEGVECAAMRGDGGELYTLTGSDGQVFPAAGTRVTVQGRIAEMSICQQGLTIAVESIQAVP
jgi:hypothetical protein